MALDGARSKRPYSVLVTGSTDGIGLQTAKNLAEDGYQVFMHGRNAKRCEAAIAAVREHAPHAPAPEMFIADLSEDSNVRKLAAAVSERCGTDGLDVLLNNAGVFETTRKETQDGIEMTFAVNVLAPLLLSRLLWDDLTKASRAREKPSRIVNASSISHLSGGGGRAGGSIDWSDLESRKQYDMYGAYGLSKLLITMVTYAMAGVSGRAQVHPDQRDVEVLCLDPGTVNTKMLFAGWGACGIAVEDAGDETWACTSEEAENGRYYVNRQERKSATVTYDRESVDRLIDVLDGYLTTRNSGCTSKAPSEPAV